MGLFLGASILTLGEFFEVLLCLMEMCCSAEKKKKSKVQEIVVPSDEKKMAFDEKAY